MKKIFLYVLVSASSMIAFASGHTVSTSGTSASCTGAGGLCDGTGTAVVSGGVGPFSYNWVAPAGFVATGQSLIYLCPATYTVTVTDSSDLSTATATLTITGPPPMSISLPSSTICEGSSVSLIPAIIGGTPGYTYSWMPVGSGSSATVTPSVSTTYTVTVTDANGCALSIASTVYVNPVPVVTVPSNITVCDGSSVSSVSTVCTASTGGASFTWLNSNTGIGLASSGPGNLPTFTGTNSGSSPINATITVTATSAGCVSAPASFTITVNPPPDATFSYSPSIYCQGTGETAIPVFPAGATAGTFSSSPGLIFLSTATGELMIDACVPGTQMVTNTIMATPGCPAVTASSPITISAETVSNFTMVPDSTNAYNFFGFNASTGSAISSGWDFGDGSTSPAPSPTHTYTTAGVYTVCLYSANSAGCGDTVCQSLNVTGVLNSCNSLFNIAHNISSSDPNAYTVTNLSYGATLTYFWDFGDTTTSTQQTPTHVYSTSSGPYLICLTVDNGAGCSNTYCDSIFSADSINRTGNPISFAVVDGPPFPMITGLDEEAANAPIAVYPNPFTETTTFVIQSDKLNEAYSFEMKDVLGKTVRKIKTNEKQFSVSRTGLENGMYFYSITNSDGVVGVGKVIIK